MVHRVIGIGRGQPLLPDDQLAGFPPFLIISIEKGKNRRNSGAITINPGRARALAVSKGFAKLLDGLATVAVEGLVQLIGAGDKTCRRGGARLARSVQDSDEAVVLTIPYPFDAGPDIRPVQTIERAMDRAARDAVLRAAPGGKHDMPVRALVQAGKVSLPNLMVSAEKPCNGLLGSFGVGDIGAHCNHRLQISPDTPV
jgi:hypothetical protein